MPYLRRMSQLYKTVKFLTELNPPRNHEHPEVLKRAADYLFKQLEPSGLKLSRNSWEARGQTYENIVAQYLPAQKSRFVMGAHYDVFNLGPGADDNASGVAALLALAQQIAQLKPSLSFGIDFVAYSLEEPPFFRTKSMGSYQHAQALAQNQIEVIGMIAFEMLGYYVRTERKKQMLSISGLKKYEAFNKKVASLLKNEDFSVRTISFSEEYKNNGPSDHRNYWLFDYPAVMLIGSSEPNPHYHQPSDTIETLNFDVLAKVVKACRQVLLEF